MAATRSSRFATPPTIWGQRQAPPTGRFRRSVPAPGGRFARTRFATPTALRYRHPRAKTGIAGLIERLRTRTMTKQTTHHRRKPAMAALAGLGVGAAALARRRRSAPEPPHTYSPPVEPSRPSTPAGVGTNGTATP